MYTYQIYIRVDQAGTIVHGFSSAFEAPQDGDVLLTDDGPRHFHLYWPESLTNDRGQYRYKWADGERVERTQQELDDEWAARPPAPPSIDDRVTDQAQRVADLELALAELFTS